MDEVEQNLGYMDDFVKRMKQKIIDVSEKHDDETLEWGDVYEHLIIEFLEFLNVDFNQAEILKLIAHSDRPWIRVKHGELKDIANLCWILEYVNRRDARNPALHHESDTPPAIKPVASDKEK